MDQNFDKCMEMLLHHEGGFINHLSDPGSMTNLGFTKSSGIISTAMTSTKSE